MGTSLHPTLLKQSTTSKHKTKTRSSPSNSRNKTPATKQRQQHSDSLAICLIGFGSHNKMYDSEYEEEVRKQAVMQVGH